MTDDLISRADAIKAIDELSQEPYYQHEGEDWCVGALSARLEIENVPSAQPKIVRCKECKHRPIKEDADRENYGFNLIEPNDGDGRCPCLVSDGWYSWMPDDNFYCGYGERRGK